jgi:hypothetical protein
MKFFCDVAYDVNKEHLGDGDARSKGSASAGGVSNLRIHATGLSLLW